MNGSMVALLGNAGLIKKVYFPRQILVFATVSPSTGASSSRWACWSCSCWSSATWCCPWLPGVVVAMVLLTVFATGIGLILSVLNVYFRDLQYLVGIGLQLWFYATPIIYPITLVHGLVAPRLAADALLAQPDGRLRRRSSGPCSTTCSSPAGGQVAYVTVWSVGMLVVGMAVFRKFEPRLAEEL